MKILVLGGAQGSVIASDLAETLTHARVTVADIRRPPLPALPIEPQPDDAGGNGGPGCAISRERTNAYTNSHRPAQCARNVASNEAGSGSGPVASGCRSWGMEAYPCCVFVLRLYLTFFGSCSHHHICGRGLFRGQTSSSVAPPYSRPFFIT